MDRRQGRARLLITAAALLLTSSALPKQLPLREARWLMTADLASDLSRQPAECLAWPSRPAERRSVEIGRVMFRAPLLLGGQAARAGLSCSSCHLNGRTNAHFHFPGVSGDPGTADVTASIMSEHRGDGIFNPKPIPDLAGDPAKLKVKGTLKLREFIHGLITQEFDGPEPPRPVLDGLVAYVRSLSPASCPPGERTVTLETMLATVNDAVRLAETSYGAGDKGSGRALLGAARSTLGAIDERFQVTGGDISRDRLRAADAELREIELSAAPTPPMFQRWRKSWPARERALRSAEPNSLFSERVLRRLIAP